MVIKLNNTIKRFLFVRNKNNTFIWSISILFISVLVAFVYFYIRLNSDKKTPNTYLQGQVSNGGSIPPYSDGSVWLSYENSAYSYMVEYPSSLKESKETSTDEYLSFVSFLSAYGTNNGGAAISVRGGELIDEVNNIKNTVLEETGAKLISEVDVKKDKYTGKKLSFSISGNEQLLPKIFYILSKDGYVYTISCDSRYAEKFFEGFNFTSK